jgi:hypothetical protein
MRKGLWATMLVWGVVLMCGASAVYAGEVDLLVQKLVEKNILSANEAQILLDDTRQEVAKQNAKGTNDMLPAWIQTTKIKGDLRLRYQTQNKEASIMRNRGRVRYRLGIETKPNDQVTVGMGLASGGADPRSTNQTFDASFAKGTINMDYAWGEYKPLSSFSVIGGKYNAISKNYLWYTTDMMWDSDINQEGASAHLDIPNVLAGDAFLNAGYWVLEEEKSTPGDAGMYYAQAGMVFNPDPVTVKFAGTYYGTNMGKSFGVLQYRKDDNTALTGNTSNTVVGGKYVYDFSQMLSGSAEIAYNFPAETSSPIKMAAVFGDYVVNPDPSSQNSGWAAGLKFGYPKVAVAKDWQLKYQYVSLGKDAWLDAFPDSDRYSGNTNIKGHELILDIGLAKNISLGLDWYMSDVLKGTKADESVFQADINMKF